VFKSRWESSNFSLLKNIQDGPSIQMVPVFFLGVNWHGHDVDNSSPSSADFKKEWSYTSTPPISVVERGKF